MKSIKVIVSFLILAAITNLVVITIASDARIFPCTITPVVAPSSSKPESHQSMCGLATMVGSSQVLSNKGNAMKILLSIIVPIIVSAGITFFIFKRKLRPGTTTS